MSFGAGNQRLRRDERATLLDVFSTCGRINKHRDQSQAEKRDQGYVEFKRHRLKDEHVIAWSQASLVQQRRSPRNLLLQFAKAYHAIVTLDAIDKRGSRGPGLRLLQ